MLEVEAAAGDLEELALQAQESRRLDAQAAQAAQAAEAAEAAEAAGVKGVKGVGLGSTEASTSSEEEEEDDDDDDDDDTPYCLSMHQPWASLLVAGIKRVEGRGWPTRHRGRLWIASTYPNPTPNLNPNPNPNPKP